MTSIPLRKLFPTQWISSPSFSSSSSCLWGPGQLCELWRALWGWPHTRPSAAASKPDVCPSSDRSASCNPLHLQPRRNAHKKCFFLDICSEKQVCHVNIWLYLSREDQVCASHHQPSHSLLLYTLILLLLLSLSVGVVRGYGFGQLLHLCGDRAMIFLKVLCMLKDAVEILLRTKLENRYFCHEQSFVISESGLKCEVCISMILKAARMVQYLVFLTALAFLLDLLLFLQFLCDTSLTQGLSLAALVGLAVQRCLQGRVTPHTNYDLLAELNWDGQQGSKTTKT